MIVPSNILYLCCGSLIVISCLFGLLALAALMLSSTISQQQEKHEQQN